MPTQITTELFKFQDKKYRDFQAKLIPTVAADSIIGVRTPTLRSLAKQLVKTEQSDTEQFVATLPHQYFDENQLHAFIISETKDFATCIAQVETFLPYIDNWATCDQLSPRVFKKHRKELLPYIDRWLTSEHTYTVRFAIGMLMQHFLDEDFNVSYAEKITTVRSEEYYIKMMIAWYFATALAKQYDVILPFIEKKCLEPWTHNKTIQKACESFRITPEQKTYLKSLKIHAK
ncbi:MAG: DNA alkylation repair protein [Treponema sp.]|nr:DNA alkylation repair protein [Treponema sp.]